MRSWAAVGALLMFLAVGLGAFGTHSLRDRLTPEDLAIFQTGVQYQTIHGLGLLALAGLASAMNPARLRWIAWLFVIGVTVFSGSLYALSLTGMRWFGAITPVGGVCFLAGWLLLIATLVGKPKA